MQLVPNYYLFKADAQVLGPFDNSSKAHTLGAEGDFLGTRAAFGMKTLMWYRWQKVSSDNMAWKRANEVVPDSMRLQAMLMEI